MAYINHSMQDDSLENVDIQYNAQGISYLDGERQSDSGTSKSSSRNVLIVITFILEFFIFAFVVVLEYFIRFTSVFPIRKQNFTCDDPALSYTFKDETLSAFSFNGAVPDAVIYSLSFAVPPFVIIIGEVGVWASTSKQQKTVHAGCEQCRIPQVLRRIIRFVGVFLFGGITLMLFIDVTKMLIGRFRPIFLEICQVDRDECFKQGGGGSMELCKNTDELAVRDAQMSFPSLFSGLSMYSSLFTAIYLHGAMQTQSVRVLRPFLGLSFCMLALLCGLTEIGLNKSHWTDVIVGFFGGIIMAIYLGVFILYSFKEYVSKRKLHRLLQDILSHHHLIQDQQFYERSRLPYYPTTWGWHIPRARANTSSDDSKVQNYDTFQRDLSRTVESFRRSSNRPSASHM